ncbi:unnamed protein product [Closterium sp. NIES-64]|nr:unnamed protein product [Closterium sp. NIES-64]
MAGERALSAAHELIKEAVLAAVREELAAHKEEVDEVQHMLIVAEERIEATAVVAGSVPGMGGMAGPGGMGGWGSGMGSGGMGGPGPGMGPGGMRAGMGSGMDGEARGGGGGGGWGMGGMVGMGNMGNIGMGGGMGMGTGGAGGIGLNMGYGPSPGGMGGPCGWGGGGGGRGRMSSGMGVGGVGGGGGCGGGIGAGVGGGARAGSGGVGGGPETGCMPSRAPHLGPSCRYRGAQFYRTKMCLKFRDGVCPYMSSCRFAHSQEELLAPSWAQLGEQELIGQVPVP